MNNGYDQKDWNFHPSWRQRGLRISKDVLQEHDKKEIQLQKREALRISLGIERASFQDIQGGIQMGGKATRILGRTSQVGSRTTSDFMPRLAYNKENQTVKFIYSNPAAQKWGYECADHISSLLRPIHQSF